MNQPVLFIYRKMKENDKVSRAKNPKYESTYAKRRRGADPSAPRLFAHRAVLRHSLAGR